MARTEARLFASTWEQGSDFRDLPRRVQGTYWCLTSLPDQTHCGVVPLREARWAGYAAGDTEAGVRADIDMLEACGKVVVDRHTGELMVRSLLRRDKVLRQPFLFPALAETARLIESPVIRAALAAEMRRVRDEGDVNDKIADDVDALIAWLDGGQATHPGPHPGPHPGSHPGSHPDRGPNTHPRPHPGPQLGGKGVGNGSSEVGSPSPLSPVPPPPAPRSARPAGAWQQQPLVASVPSLKPGEGDENLRTPEPGDVEALAAEVRAIRPEWTMAKIRKAITNPRTLERPWPVVRRAALIAAQDPKSITPGRLPEDGDWWARAARGLAPPTGPAEPQARCARHGQDHPAASGCPLCAGEARAVG